MSRLIVKNLPSHVSDKRIRDHFSSQAGATITDVKLVHRADGTFRRFAFVGFKTEQEAAKAKEYYDKTYIDSSKINVLVVDPSKALERPAKRPKLDDAFSAPIAPSSTATTSKSAHTNETVLDEPLPLDDDETVSDLEWMRRRMAASAIDVDSGDGDPAMFTKETNKTTDDPGSKNPEVRKSTIREEDEEDSIVKLLEENPRLFLRNLAYSCTNADLDQVFRRFGTIVQAYIPLDPITQSSKGLAYITFASKDSAFAALKAMDKSTFQGRILHVMPAVSRRGKPELDAGGVDWKGKKNLRETRLQKSKDVAGKDFNWSMLYMNSDAVVSSVADRFNLSKADILNSEGDDGAVKLALAETHIIQETKKYLQEEGVILDSFQNSLRSDTTILVKNIPYGTTTSQLEELFSPHGEIVRLLLPPAGTIAVVEMSNSSEASKVFRNVAYRRLGGSVVYLEKAPLGLFRENEDDRSSRQRIHSGVKPVVVSSIELDAPVTETTGTDAPVDRAGSSPVGATLFIKNLNFTTTTEKLVKSFRHLSGFSFARVQTKADPKHPGQTLSMGFGFVGFKDKNDAKQALKALEGFVLDGHALVVKFAQRGAEEVGTESKVESVGKSSTTKMIVKNLPFEATKKDVRALFGAHGQLKSVRVPKKFDSSSRGFAFLEFVSRKEAENAFDALKHTHLLGRHVVLEWAEDAGAGGDLENLRERVKAAYGDGKEERPGRKRKLNMDSTLEVEEEGEDFIAV